MVIPMRELENKIAINGHLVDRRIVLGVGLVLGGDFALASVLQWSKWLHSIYKQSDLAMTPQLPVCPKPNIPPSEMPPCPISDP